MQQLIDKGFTLIFGQLVPIKAAFGGSLSQLILGISTMGGAPGLSVTRQRQQHSTLLLGRELLDEIDDLLVSQRDSGHRGAFPSTKTAFVLYHAAMAQQGHHAAGQQANTVGYILSA
jgi:hypothetical protein